MGYTCPPPSRPGPWLCRVFKEESRGSGHSHMALTRREAAAPHSAFPRLTVPRSFRNRVADGKHAKTLTLFMFWIINVAVKIPPVSFD